MRASDSDCEAFDHRDQRSSEVDVQCATDMLDPVWSASSSCTDTARVIEPTTKGTIADGMGVNRTPSTPKVILDSSLLNKFQMETEHGLRSIPSGSTKQDKAAPLARKGERLIQVILVISMIWRLA